MEGKCWAEIVKYVAIKQLTSKDIAALFNRFINNNQFEVVEFLLKICREHNKQLNIEDSHSIIINFMSLQNDLPEKYFKLFAITGPHNLDFDWTLIYQLAINMFNKVVYEHVRGHVNFQRANIPKIINDFHTFPNYEERINYFIKFSEINNRMNELSLVYPLVNGNMKFVDFILNNKIEFNKNEILVNQFLKNLLMRDENLNGNSV